MTLQSYCLKEYVVHDSNQYTFLFVSPPLKALRLVTFRKGPLVTHHCFLISSAETKCVPLIFNNTFQSREEPELTWYKIFFEAASVSS